MRRKIIRNAAKCNHCGAIIESTYRHDFKTCSCGRVSVDGGHDYLRRCYASPEDLTDLSVTEAEGYSDDPFIENALVGDGIADDFNTDSFTAGIIAGLGVGVVALEIANTGNEKDNKETEEQENEETCKYPENMEN